jgi:hypothetical protein
VSPEVEEMEEFRMRTEGVRRLRILGVVASLLLVLSLWAWDVGRGEEAQRLAITAQQGRLSVDLKDAEISAILAQIGKEADITIVFESAPRKRVSARFSDIELEIGLRRLLGLAALNYIIVYAEQPEGAIGVRELRVLDAVPGRSEHAGRRVGEPLPSAQPVSAPPTRVMESEGARRFREAIERAR